MITLYTAIGTYKLNRNGYPSVVSGEREYSLDTFELIMWSVLSYRISSYDELKEMFCQKVQNSIGILNDGIVIHGIHADVHQG